MRTIPDAKLKKPPPEKGWRLFWVVHQDLQGNWHAKRKADIKSDCGEWLLGAQSHRILHCNAWRFTI